MSTAITIGGYTIPPSRSEVAEAVLRATHLFRFSFVNQILIELEMA
jgi:hypothetical protein